MLTRAMPAIDAILPAAFAFRYFTEKDAAPRTPPPRRRC